MEKALLILNFFAILGVPTVFAIVVAILKKLQVLMKAQQEQMRGQLLKDFYTYKNRGFVYEYEVKDWELQYQAYHALGKNGIMDKRHEALLTMETRNEID